MTPEQKIEHVLAFVGALVPLMSALASLINHVVREKQANGEPVSPMLLQGGALLNVGAINLDKAVQLSNLAKKKKGGKDA